MKLQPCTEWLFFHLWKQSPETQKSCPGIVIPDTVFYRWACPYFYYFTNVDGEIIRKTREKIMTSEIIANFSQTSKNNEILAKVLHCVPAKDNKERSAIEFEYIIQKEIDVYLNRKPKKLQSIFQKFVLPMSAENQLIKVIWTPQFCLFYKRQNKCRLDKQNVKLVEKLATFNGDEFHSTEDPVRSPTQQQDLENCCLSMVKHIQEVSGGNIQINRMVLYFKINDQNILNLLFCTEILVRQKCASLMEDLVIDLKERQDSPLMKIVDHNTKQEFQYNQMMCQENMYKLQTYDGQFCLYCKKIAPLYDLAFKYIIECFDKNIMSNEMFTKKNPNYEKEKQKMPNYASTLKEHGIDYKLPFLNDYYEQNKEPKNMPFFIEFVWGTISQIQYQKLKANCTWLSLTTKVCDECFMNFTQQFVKKDYQLSINSLSPQNACPIFQSRRLMSPSRIDTTFIKKFKSPPKPKIAQQSSIHQKEETEKQSNDNKTFFTESITLKKSQSRKLLEEIPKDKLERFSKNIINSAKTYQNGQRYSKKQFEYQKNLHMKLDKIQEQKKQDFFIKKNFKETIEKSNMSKTQPNWNSNSMQKNNFITSIQSPIKKVSSTIIQSPFLVKPKKQQTTKQIYNNQTTMPIKKLDSSFNSESTQDASRTNINHNYMLKTIKNLKILVQDM